MTLDEVWNIVKTMRVHRLPEEACAALADILAQSAADPLVVAEEIKAMLWPARVPPARGGTPEQKARRKEMRERLNALLSAGWAGQPDGFLFHHHPDDYDALVSAVQYRARKGGYQFSVEAGRVDGQTYVTVYLPSD